jgi:hypothetical protein
MDAQILAEPRRPRLNPFMKALRRERIFVNLRLGRSYADIAGEEGLSERRVRQIVSEAVQRRSFDGPRDHALLHFMRIESAHGLAAEAIAAGDLRAIGPYLKVLDRLDRYQKGGAAKDGAVYDAAARKRLLAKLNRIAARLEAADARRAAKSAGANPPLSAPGTEFGADAESDADSDLSL